MTLRSLRTMRRLERFPCLFTNMKFMTIFLCVYMTDKHWLLKLRKERYNSVLLWDKKFYFFKKLKPIFFDLVIF